MSNRAVTWGRGKETMRRDEDIRCHLRRELTLTNGRDKSGSVGPCLGLPKDTAPKKSSIVVYRRDRN